jgi:hypothetical protein
MVAKNKTPEKKYFTPAQANAMLPLVRRIVQDITELVSELRACEGRLLRLRPQSRRDDPSAEFRQAEEEFEHGRQRLGECVVELRQLGVELKDPATGLVDFPCWKDGREVYLCWRQGEPEIGYWHEVDAGFAGRQKLLMESRTE